MDETTPLTRTFSSIAIYSEIVRYQTIYPTPFEHRQDFMDNTN